MKEIFQRLRRRMERPKENGNSSTDKPASQSQPEQTMGRVLYGRRQVERPPVPGRPQAQTDQPLKRPRPPELPQARTDQPLKPQSLPEIPPGWQPKVMAVGRHQSERPSEASSQVEKQSGSSQTDGSLKQPSVPGSSLEKLPAPETPPDQDGVSLLSKQSLADSLDSLDQTRRGQLGESKATYERGFAIVRAGDQPRMDALKDVFDEQSAALGRWSDQQLQELDQKSAKWGFDRYMRALRKHQAEYEGRLKEIYDTYVRDLQDEKVKEALIGAVSPLLEDKQAREVVISQDYQQDRSDLERHHQRRRDQQQTHQTEGTYQQFVDGRAEQEALMRGIAGRTQRNKVEQERRHQSRIAGLNARFRQILGRDE